MAEDTIRIDKWLWAARFFKTRSLAAKAVSGGHVHLNGSRIKAARQVRPGDSLVIRRGALEWTVIIQALSGRRGPATLARTLYEETEDSMVAREQASLERKLVRSPSIRPDRRPDKRERRKIRQFLRKD